MTTNELSGEETDYEHVKKVTSYKTYIYDVAHDKEIGITSLLTLFNIMDKDIISGILTQNNIKENSQEDKNIRNHMLDISNTSVNELTSKSIDLKLNCGNKEYDVKFQK